MRHICDTLLPKFENTWIYKLRKFIDGFIINVGIFKSFGFIVSILISLRLLNIIYVLENALAQKTISIGEYEASIISTCLFLMIICYYELYYIDNILKWVWKE